MESRKATKSKKIDYLKARNGIIIVRRDVQNATKSIYTVSTKQDG